MAEALALGTDSNLRIDFTEEMRLLEYGARLTQERRGVTLVCRANYPAMDGLVDFLTAECCLDAQTRCRLIF